MHDAADPVDGDIANLTPDGTARTRRRCVPPRRFQVSTRRHHHRRPRPLPPTRRLHAVQRRPQRLRTRPVAPPPGGVLVIFSGAPCATTRTTSYNSGAPTVIPSTGPTSVSVTACISTMSRTARCSFHRSLRSRPADVVDQLQNEPGGLVIEPDPRNARIPHVATLSPLSFRVAPAREVDRCPRCGVHGLLDDIAH